MDLFWAVVNHGPLNASLICVTIELGHIATTVTYIGLYHSRP